MLDLNKSTLNDDLLPSDANDLYSAPQPNNEGFSSINNDLNEELEDFSLSPKIEDDFKTEEKEETKAANGTFIQVLAKVIYLPLKYLQRKLLQHLVGKALMPFILRSVDFWIKEFSAV